MLRTTTLLVAASLAAPALAQLDDDAPPRAGSEAPAPPADLDEAAVVRRSVELLLGMQEAYDDPDAPAEASREWPYEGVYKVSSGTRRGGRVIPSGYRVGGTSIAAWALLTAPGYADDETAQAAVARALDFVLEFFGREDMAAGFDAGYDVRGWGHAYGLWFLLQLRAHDAVPEGRAGDVDAWVKTLIETLAATEIQNGGGGWNYSRGRGFGGRGNAASPFMTGPTLIALYEARRQGEDIDDAVVERALAALEATRLEDGSEDPLDGGFSYGYARGGRGERPGAMGRICSAEVALHLAGRSSVERLRSGVECFVRHWDQLEVRRRQNGTHVAPYGVAPYYVYFAHYHAALAITLLPESEQAEWRAKYLGRLFQSRQESGGWNDRVFDRSENYGTALALLSLIAPDAPALPAWRPAGAAKKSGGD